jgi:hypothetical protein
MRLGGLQTPVGRGRASLPGRVGRRRAMAPTLAALCLAVLLSLAGCALPRTGPARPADVAPPSPTATATPAPWMGAPHGIPVGWKVYYAAHFTLALPPDWWVVKAVLPDSTPAHPHIRYALYAPQDWRRGAVDEWDGIAPAQIRDEFCTPTADYTVRTVAGLSMRFSNGLNATGAGRFSPYERDWTFISDRGTVYWLWVDDGPIEDVDLHMTVNRAVVETFAPEYAAWGCT